MMSVVRSRPMPLAALALALTLVSLAVGSVSGSGQPLQAPSAPTPSFKVLADQVAALFPMVQTEVVEAAEARVTLADGRQTGVQPGIELTVVREGRELYHPTTKKLLGRTQQTLGRVVVTEVFDAYSVARLVEGGGAIQPGDRALATAGKVRLTVLPLTTGGRSKIVESATYDLIQELERTGRFQTVFGDQIIGWLAQERIAVEDFMRGQGVRQATERFKISHLLAVHFTTVQGKPFMDVRAFSSALQAPLLQSALFVPPAVRAEPAQQFSSGANPQVARIERRSLLARLLSGDWEPNTYSAGAASIPIRSIATFPFMVVSMDVAVAPADKVPRLVITDGQRVFVYRINGEKLDAEWTFDKRQRGRILSVQFADLNGDGVLDVVANRQDVRTGMLSYVLTTRGGRAAVLADDLPLLLLAVDEAGDGINKGLWGQSYSPDRFWTVGTAMRYVLNGNDVAATTRPAVHDAFRPTGATFSNIGGKERVLAFVDEHNRLRVALGGQELWRSITVVGGGLAQGHLQIPMLQTMVDKYFKFEPNPVSVDLDGDGIHEVVVPVNEDEAGRMAIVFRGPAGYRFQVVSSGFEGFVTGIGAIPGEGANPSLVVAVVRRIGLLKQSGETQIVITLAE
ncbi:MAG TPA: hypothetical protein VLF19_05615 [Methylomirabilota bacterium]|nr:hypothetical protein [Methylomirabilota bacterium]